MNASRMFSVPEENLEINANSWDKEADALVAIRKGRGPHFLLTLERNPHRKKLFRTNDKHIERTAF
jgi:hypothetical protein